MHITTSSQKFLTIFLIGLFCQAFSLPSNYQTKARIPTLVISLDGVQSIKFESLIANNLNSNIRKYFINEGVKAEHMVPSFPSDTFPNHFALITGKKIR